MPQPPEVSISDKYSQSSVSFNLVEDSERLRLPFAILAVVLEDVTQSVAEDSNLSKSDFSAIRSFADKFLRLAEKSGEITEAITSHNSDRQLVVQETIDYRSTSPRRAASNVSKRPLRPTSSERVSSGTAILPVRNSPRSRWAALTVKIMRPSARMELIKISYTVQDVWADYLGKLRNNEEGYVQEYEQALAKIDIALGSASKQLWFSRIGDSSDSLLIALGGSRRKCSFVIYPDTLPRTLWVTLSLLVLLHDTVMLPLNVFFDPADSSLLMDFLMWFCTIFWIIDIAVTCITARYVNASLETRLGHIIYYYAKSWLLFDSVLVLFDLVLAFWRSQVNDNTAGLSAIRSIRALKCMRIARLSKMKFMLRSIVIIDAKVGYSIAEFCKLAILYAICIHLSACFWYGIGYSSDDGWGKACNHDPKATSTQCYFRAAHWAMSHLHGTTDIIFETTSEWAMSVLAMIIGFFLSSFFMARAFELVKDITSTHKAEMRQWCATYSKRRKLSQYLARRLMRSIEAGEREEDVLQSMKKEREMMQMLSVLVQEEILEEIRKPLLMSFKIFRDVSCLSKRVVSQLCFEAITAVVCLSGDIAFASGETGTCLRIVDFGSLVYVDRKDRASPDLHTVVMQNQPSRGSRYSRKSQKRASKPIFDTDQSFSRSSFTEVSTRPSIFMTAWETVASLVVDQGACTTLHSGASVGEMVLWTPWVHTGDLRGASDSVILQLGLDIFHAVVKVRLDACLLVAKYAQRYVRQMTAARFGVSDLFVFEDDDDDYDDKFEDLSNAQHLIFLSHFKEEAGTEATLMQEAFSKILQHEGYSDIDSFVFLDSEDLTDLTMLRDHVVKSRNLVLLLSPSVLSRPWCLVEIVTAMQHGVQIVPIDIQRPGMKFNFPDDDYYKRMSNGELLSAADAKILIDEGITLANIEEAVRFAFMQIALPFSPHKSKGIREAELHDILRRCWPKGHSKMWGLAGSSLSQMSYMSSNDRKSSFLGPSGSQYSKKTKTPEEEFFMPTIASERWESTKYGSSEDGQGHV